MFHHEDSITKTSDVFRTFYQSFVRVGMKHLKTKALDSQQCLSGGNGSIKEVTVLNQHDQFSGVLALVDVELPTKYGEKRAVTMETWFAPLSHEELLNLNMSRGPQRLLGLEVRTSNFHLKRVEGGGAKVGAHLRDAMYNVVSLVINTTPEKSITPEKRTILAQEIVTRTRYRYDALTN